MIFSIKIIWYLNSEMFERRNNRKHFSFPISIDFQIIVDNDHLKQRRNKSFVISYNLKVAGRAEMAFAWTQQNPVRV